MIDDSMMWFKKKNNMPNARIGLLFICDAPIAINSRMVRIDGNVVHGDNKDVETTMSCAIENLSGMG